MRVFVNRLIDNISNIKWNFIFYCKLLFQSQFRKLLNSNKRFKNIYKGQRCFIIGNGPSLTKMDLSKLANEVVFTVNTIMSNRNIYDTLNTDFHFVIDPFYFRQSVDLPEEKATIDLLKQINYEKKKPVCIVSYEGINAFKSYGLDKTLDLAYIYQHINLTESYTPKINLTRNIPTSQNVVQAAIFSAIYMGFKEIYLVGCDMTSIFITYESNDNGETTISNDTHAYKFSDNEMKNLLKESNRLDNEYMLHDYAKVFAIFKNIRKYAERNGIEIINATKGGGLDTYKRIDYDTLFGNDK
jgi:hypothetical protein